MRPGSVVVGLFPLATQVHAFGVPPGRGGLAGDLGPLLGSEAVGARLRAAFDAEDRTVTSSRHGVVGPSHAIQQFGSLFALTAGARIAGQFGPKSAFLFLGLASFLLALPFALALPRERAEPRPSRPR